MPMNVESELKTLRAGLNALQHAVESIQKQGADPMLSKRVTELETALKALTATVATKKDAKTAQEQEFARVNALVKDLNQNAKHEATEIFKTITDQRFKAVDTQFMALHAMVAKAVQNAK